MKKLSMALAFLAILLSAGPLIAEAVYSSDSQVINAAQTDEANTFSEDQTFSGDIFVDGGDIGLTSDPGIIHFVFGGVTLDATTTIKGAVTLPASVPAGDSHSYELKLEAHNIAGDVTWEGGLQMTKNDLAVGGLLFVNGPDSATGASTSLLAMNSDLFVFVTPMDIGMTGQFRPANIYMSGDLEVESGDANINGAISAGGDITTGGGMVTELTYWYQDNVAISQTDAVLDMDGNASRTEVPTVRAGSVIGIAVYSNEARTAGTLTVDATIDGTKTGLTAVLDGTNPSTKVTTQGKDTDAFTAGQRIGVKLTTDGTWAPVTADITVVVLIEQ